MRRYVAFTMALVVASALLAGCSSKDKTEDNTNTTAVSGTAVQESKEEAPTESGDKTKEIVNYWHIHTGDEAKVEDELIAAYNASQDKYEVVGLSMNDQQKLIVALSSDEGPDVIFSSNANLTTYYFTGLLKDLQEYADRDQIDFSQWTDKAIQACTFDGKLYAMPESGGSAIQMFYNKNTKRRKNANTH